MFMKLKLTRVSVAAYSIFYFKKQQLESAVHVFLRLKPGPHTKYC
jgi:hypothetical protein